MVSNSRKQDSEAEPGLESKHSTPGCGCPKAPQNVPPCIISWHPRPPPAGRDHPCRAGGTTTLSSPPNPAASLPTDAGNNSETEKLSLSSFFFFNFNISVEELVGNRQGNKLPGSLPGESAHGLFVLILSSDEKFAMVREALNKQNCDGCFPTSFADSTFFFFLLRISFIFQQQQCQCHFLFGTLKP